MDTLKKLLLIPAAMLLLAGCVIDKKALTGVTTSKTPVLIDVRSLEEYRSGHLQGSINIPHSEIAEKIATSVPDRSSAIQLYCRSGRRVKAAMQTLQGLGYKNLEDLGGLKDAGQQLKLPIVK